MNSRIKEINLNDYDIGEEIGCGAFGKVYTATNKQTLKNVAIKIMDFHGNEIQKTEFINSIEFYNHRFKGTVKLLDFGQTNHVDDKTLYFITITELLNYGDVSRLTREYLKTNGANHDQMNPTIRSKIIFGVASILKKMHKENAIFRDLKLRKIGLNDKYEPVFLYNQLAKIIIDPLNMTMNIGTPLYMAPELFIDNDDGYSFPVDVYSYGFLILSMFTNNIKINGKLSQSTQRFMMMISKGYRPEKPDLMPEIYWDLIQRCWKQDSNERPTFEEIVDILKDDKYALEEFGMMTNLDELHEYQQRMEN